MREAFSNSKNEHGFTLIELLVTCAIILVLSGIALTGFTLYKDSAYRRSAEQMMQQTRTALEAGKQDVEDATDTIEVTLRAAGPMATADAQALLPGLVLPEQFWIYALHNPACDDEVCMEDYVIARSCHTEVRNIYFKTHGGIESMTWNVADAAPCP